MLLGPGPLIFKMAAMLLSASLQKMSSLGAPDKALLKKKMAVLIPIGNSTERK